MNPKLFLPAVFLALAGILPAEEAMDIPLAVTTLAQAGRHAPTAAEQELSKKYLASGLAFLKKDQPQRAVQEFKDSVRLNATSDGYKALGTAYYQASNVPKAVWAYQESLKLKKDPKVRALVDQLQGFGSDHQVLDLNAKMEEAQEREKAGRRDSALGSYVQAWNIRPSADSAGPALRLAAALAEEDLKAKAVARAIEVMAQVEPLKKAADLTVKDKAAIASLTRSEDLAFQLTGARLRDHEKAMLSDKQAWQRALSEKLAGKVHDINLHIPAE